MKLALTFAAIAAASAPHLAQAECANPHWVGTPPGTRLPTKGSLFVYDGSLSYRGNEMPPIDAHWTGMQPKSVRQTRVSENVIRYDFEATLPATLELDRDAWEPRRFGFDPSWHAPRLAPRVLQYWHHVYQWTCSNADSVMFQIDQPTAAFRVSWKAGLHTAELVIPAKTDDDNRSVLELGKPNCASANLDPDELLAGGTLTITAIRLDGSEIAVTGVPDFVSTKQMPTDTSGIDRAFRLGVVDSDSDDEVVTPPAIEETSESPLIGGFAVIVCLLGALIGLRAGRKVNAVMPLETGSPTLGGAANDQQML